MAGCTRTVLEQDVYTALYGFGAGLPVTDEDGRYTGGYRKKLTFGEVNGGVNWVGDEDARLVWGRWNADRTAKVHSFGQVIFSECDDPARLLALTVGADGQNPNVGQLSGNSPQPFIDELRALACQFSGATGVPLNSLGIVQDNPSSAEAIQAAREDICLVAERDIEADKATLRRVMQAAMAIEKNTTVDGLDQADADIMASFASPMLYSLSSRTDAAIKIAAVDEGFAGSQPFHEMVGFDEATTARLESEKRKEQARAAIFADITAQGVRNGRTQDSGGEAPIPRRERRPGEEVHLRADAGRAPEFHRHRGNAVLRFHRGARGGIWMG